jgi:hypothetical protein
MEHTAGQLSVIWQNSLHSWRINYLRCVLQPVTLYNDEKLSCLCNKTLSAYQQLQVVARRKHQRFQNQLRSRHQGTKFISPMTRTETVLETSVFSPFNNLTRLVARENFTAFSRRKFFRSCSTPYLCLKTKPCLEEKAGGNKVRYPSIKTLLILLRQYVPSFSYYIK